MKRFVYILTGVVVAAAALSAAAAPANHAISVERISSAINEVGISTSPGEITLLSQVRATTNAPKLKVRSIQNEAEHAAIVRIECENPGECVPFFVKTQLSQSEGSADSPLTPSQTQAIASKAASRPIVVRAGTQTSLLLEGNRVHIRITVVCMGNGAPGDRIRVRSIDNRQFYVAEVVDANSLKGSL
jgi:hypothetical protein